MAEGQFIGRYVDYFDERGRRVRERIVELGEAPPDFARFITGQFLRIPTKRGLVERRFVVHLKADSVPAAFEIMEDAVRKAAAELAASLAPRPKRRDRKAERRAGKRRGQS